MVSLCLVQFVDVLGVTVMVTALPAMLADLRASADAASLISTGRRYIFGALALGRMAVTGVRDAQLAAVSAQDAQLAAAGAAGTGAAPPYS